ncbi:MAG: hypothetical protein EOO46_25590 [Flavobacterium sp.]|nr:MAG: hypothetical protein EOO46_25590 [Flavobacterium sp.]
MSQRLSLVMNPGDIQLYKVSGTSILDMYALAVDGKTFQKNGYTQIDQKDFLALKTVEVSDRLIDLVLYESGEKIGQLGTDLYGNFYLSELCTGTSESLCTFNWDEANKGFTFTFLPKAATTEEK